jgi:hypothetical protein
MLILSGRSRTKIVKVVQGLVEISDHRVVDCIVAASLSSMTGCHVIDGGAESVAAAAPILFPSSSSLEE